MSAVTLDNAERLVSNPRSADSIPVALTVTPELSPPSVILAVTAIETDAAGAVRISSFPENAADGVTPIPVDASIAVTNLSRTTDKGDEAEELAVTSASVTVYVTAVPPIVIEYTSPVSTAPSRITEKA